MAIQLTSLHKNVLHACHNIVFRQSMINDFLDCGQVTLYRWILRFDDETQFMAAILGTAGHACVYDMHVNKKFDYSYVELITNFVKHFDKALAEAATLPNIGTKFASIQEQRDAMAPAYAAFLHGYQQAERNLTFISTVNEQSFVMVVTDPRANEITNGSRAGDERFPPFIFTGQIDQAGYYPDGMFSVRDLKFRDNAFRPQKTEFDLNVQMTIYALALRIGNPACVNCRPVNLPDGTLHYGGPCETCKAKINTPAWPRKYPNYCELVWMRDFERREKDEYQKFIKDPEKKRTINPTTGRPVIRNILNPKWLEGYKTGDYRGPGFIITTRTPQRIEILMSDVLRVCEQIREGKFFRRPSSKCAQWCHQKDRCIQGLELQVEEITGTESVIYGTDEPF